jgi:hypothetical protein
MFLGDVLVKGGLNVFVRTVIVGEVPYDVSRGYLVLNCQLGAIVFLTIHEDVLSCRTPYG